MRPFTIAAAIALASVSASGLGCGATPMRLASLDEVERVRVTDDTKAAAERAPGAFARAEQERDFARAAHAEGDDVAANLHAERAVAAYAHAGAVARLAAATSDLADALKALADATAQEQALAVSRTKIDLDAEDLERRAQLARDRLLPASSAGATGDREAARLAAARSLATEARLLCGAARLAGGAAESLASAGDELDKLSARLGGSPAAPGDRTRTPVIDDAGAVRSHCLDALTRARRASGQDDGRADALLAELSASGGWDPTRDERGIVVTLRGAFAGTALTDDGKSKLENLGRVAAAHEAFRVQLVVHDAVAPAAKDDGDARRAEAAVKALVAAGAQAGRVKSELAGAFAPVVDAADPRLRSRNERVDVVFVPGG